MKIRPICEEDIPACLEIYNAYIVRTTVTFEETPLQVVDFRERVRRIRETYPYLVAEEDGQVVGYAYLDAYSSRSAYRYTADLSIYLRMDMRGKGLGEKLLEAVERCAIRQGLRNIVSVVTQENEASLAFHEKHGYRHCGRLHHAGLKMGRWLDVVFLQKELPAEGPG